MDEKDAAALSEVQDALKQRGFVRDWGTIGPPVYRGELDPTALKIPISVTVDDLDFVEFPLIKVDQAFPIEGQLPHLLGLNRSLCYYAKGSVVLDRYDPGGTMLQCLDQAEIVAREAIRGRSADDFAHEFAAYWSPTKTLVDLPADYVGPAKIRFVKLGLYEQPTPVLAVSSSWLWGRESRSKLDRDEEFAFVVKVQAPLALDPDGPWPPENLSALNEWFAWAAPNIVGCWESSLAKDNSTATATIAIRAPNGLFLFRAAVPNRFHNQEFLKSRRENLGQMMSKVAAQIPVERILGERADSDYITRRNLGAMANLSGKRILQIGCGTIGSFLAQHLAQCGAGTGDGTFTLIDSDIMHTANIGRHLLGVPYLHVNKATACAAFLSEQLAPLAVEAKVGDALSLDIVWSRYDLVIDATGEEALSLALNDREIRQRPRSVAHLFVWLIGNGAAVRCLLTGEAGYSCLKCLKPVLSGPPRFHELRLGVDVEEISDRSCGDSTYRPFPVSRAAAAAALACDIVLDWANGACSDRFRALTLDSKLAYEVRNSSPKSLERCAACGS